MKRIVSCGVLFAVGMAGILSLWPTLDTAIATVQATTPAAVPEALLRPLMLVQPTLLLLLGTVAGGMLAHRVGLRSLIVDRLQGFPDARSLPVDFRLAIAGGLAAALVIAGGDVLFARLDPDSFARLTVPPAARLQALVTGVLYGGLTEEIITRWGLMTVIAWALTKARLPRSAAIGIAVVAAAAIFALGHLPALAMALGEPSTLVVIRTIGLNTVAGILFGLLFWRRNLETAMLAHASTHVLLYGAHIAGLGL